MTDLSSFQTLYLQTAKENIQAVKDGLILLAQNKAERGAIESVFRNSHTLKSKSYVMGQKQIGDLAKSIEDLFYEPNKGTTAVTDQIVAQANQTLQIIEQQLALVV